MNRPEFQQLAEVRIREAEALLAAGFWDGAYYLAGYAVECGLKACILKLVEQTGIIFDDRKFAEKCWTHNLDDLVDLLGLTADVKSVKGSPPTRPDVATRWEVVKDWKETSRYARIPEQKARGLFAAITDPAYGVLQWIRAYW
jgi:hypothetical protein